MKTDVQGFLVLITLDINFRNDILKKRLIPFINKVFFHFHSISLVLNEIFFLDADFQVNYHFNADQYCPI